MYLSGFEIIYGNFKETLASNERIIYVFVKK